MSAFIGSGMEDDEDKQHDDEDLKADPISQINMPVSVHMRIRTDRAGTSVEYAAAGVCLQYQ